MSYLAAPRRLLRALLLVSLLAPLPAAAQNTIRVKPTGVFASIDVSKSISAIDIFKGGSDQQKATLLGIVEAVPEHFSPPVFYAAAREHAARGELDKALFWHYAGQLRARYDANRCAEPSARAAVATLNALMPEALKQHQFAIVERLEPLVRSVLAWDERTPYQYDHRWINLHGNAALASGMGQPLPDDLALSLPAAQWPALRKRTREEWLSGFLQALPKFRELAGKSAPR